MTNKPFKWAAGLFLTVVLFVGLLLLTDRVFQKSWKLPTGNLRPAVAIGDNHGVILASDGSLWTWLSAVGGLTLVAWLVLAQWRIPARR